MNSLVDSFTAEAKKTNDYKDLFQACEHNSVAGLLTELNHKITSHILNACDVLEEKGFTLTKEAYDFLYQVPWLWKALEKNHSSKTSACCVDKTRYDLSQTLFAMLKKDESNGNPNT